jgi:hypothetical protein
MVLGYARWWTTFTTRNSIKADVGYGRIKNGGWLGKSNDKIIIVMLTIERFDILVGRTFVMPDFTQWIISEATTDLSPARQDPRYIVKLKTHGGNEVMFALYRDITKKEKGYRMYNNVLMDYTIVKLESLKDMRKFTDVLKTQLQTFNQAI